MLLVVIPEAVHAQPQTCSVSDLSCLDNSHVQACKVGEKAIESCLSWLNLLQELIGDNPLVTELHIVKGFAHYSLYERLRHSDSELSGMHKDLAKNAFYTAHTIDEASVQAMRGLSNTSETIDDVMLWNNRIMKVDPSDNIAARTISSLIIQEKGQQGYIDAANLLAKNYSIMEDGSAKWALAERIVDYLEHSTEERQLERFRQQVADDAAVNQIYSVRNEDVIENTDMVLTMVSTSCNASIMTILSDDYCVAGVQEVLKTQGVTEMSWEVAHLDRFLFSVNSLILFMPSENLNSSGVEFELEEWINSLIDQGTETGSLYQMYQYLVRDEPQRALTASLRAVELEPERGDYQLMAGKWLLQQGQIELGIDYLEKAKQYLPSTRHQGIDRQIQDALGQL
ncbi:MAG: hypothetical protein H7A05_10545 [Pseudomonadales bacterium]|nr:hypothetical protein [Pseudomonadales bacterium]MCP5330723.1 hypothetical protein [Pseudomonadales bacterium]MCP5345052.1 hypothetical protein [Pseudomonadales bacterium]